MEFNVLHVFILCVCFGQMCTASNNLTNEEKNKVKENIQNKVPGVGDQFIDDMLKILEQNRTNPQYIGSLHLGLLNILNDMNLSHENKKIDENIVKDFKVKNDFYVKDTSVLPKAVDYWKIIQSMLSKELPPERYNGIFNLYFIFVYPNATSEEIESALNYLYGIDTAATKMSYIDSHSIRSPVPDDCSQETNLYSEAIDGLKSMIDIKPKVFQDLASIHEKFTCDFTAMSFLAHEFVYHLKKLHGDKSKINACMVIKSRSDLEQTTEQWERYSKPLESILSTRLPDESFRGLINIVKIRNLNTPINEIEPALEYLYDDVSKTECSP